MVRRIEIYSRYRQSTQTYSQLSQMIIPFTIYYSEFTFVSLNSLMHCTISFLKYLHNLSMFIFKKELEWRNTYQIPHFSHHLNLNRCSNYSSNNYLVEFFSKIHSCHFTRLTHIFSKIQKDAVWNTFIKVDFFETYHFHWHKENSF